MLRRFVLITLAVAVLLPTAAVLAEHHESAPPPMAWLRYYQVKPGMGAEFVERLHALSAAHFDAMVDTGTLRSWGMTQPFTRTGADWTHMLWLAGTSWSDFDAFLADYAPDEAALASLYETIESSYDQILRHMDYLPGSAEPAYLRISYYKAQPGQDESVMGLYKEIGHVTYKGLQEDGTVGAAGMSVQEVVMDGSWSHAIWVFLPRLASLEKATTAQEALLAEIMAEEGQEAFQERVTSAIDWDAYRSEIQRVIHVKLPPTE